ncbi:MAG: hypothetical protein ACP5G0_01985, partial [Desulfomonilia bacterium]
MKKTRASLLILVWLWSFLAIFPAASHALQNSSSQQITEISPLKEHVELTGEILRYLKTSHFSKIRVDDALSNMVFDT